jgi:predicted ester cyclase
MDLWLKYFDESRKDIIQENMAMETGFPRYELRPSNIVVEGNKVVVRAQFRGNHLGSYKGIEPTGREVTQDMVLIFTIEQGRISDLSGYYDTAGFMEQLSASTD